MTRHFTRSAVVLFAAMFMLSMLAGAAEAAVSPSTDFSYAEKGVTAMAFWESCEGPDADGTTACSQTQAFVFDGRQRSRDPELGRSNGGLTYLCVYRASVLLAEEGFPLGPVQIEQGCLDGIDLTYVKTLESLEASAPALELSELLCTIDPETGEELCEAGASRTVAVELSVTGIGPITTGRWHSNGQTIVDGVRCATTSSGKGINRDAIASLVIDGLAASGDSVHAQLTEGSMRFAQNCH